MVQQRYRKGRGFTLLEALVTITLGTLIMLSVFQSSFTANRATAQTEQSMEAENILASRLSVFLSEAETLTVPINETELIMTKSAEYTLTKSVVKDASRPHCALAKLKLTWKQGRLDREREVECLLPLNEPAGTGP